MKTTSSENAVTSGESTCGGTILHSIMRSPSYRATSRPESAIVLSRCLVRTLLHSKETFASEPAMSAQKLAVDTTHRGKYTKLYNWCKERKHWRTKARSP